MLVVRLHLVVGASADPRRRSGTDRLLDAVRRRERPLLYEDEFRSPIHVLDTARTLLDLAARGPVGILHLGGPERLSRHDIGRILVETAGLDPEFLRRGSIRDHPGLPRTPDTPFDTTLARSVLRIPPRPIAEALE